MKQVPRLLVASVLCVAGCGRTDTADRMLAENDHRIHVEVMCVEPSQITKTLETVGTLLPVQAATIVAEVDGVIRYLPDSDRKIEYEEDGQQKSFPLGLDIGSRVAKGEVLVQLDATDAELALEQAEAHLNLVQKKLEDLVAWRRAEEIQQLEARAEQARAARALAEADLSRNQRLMTRNATSVAEHDALLAAAQQARAAQADAEAALALAQAGPTPEQIAVARAELQSAGVEVRKREREVEKTIIRCPYPAVVTDRFVGVGDRVTAMPRVEIMSIADPRMLFAEVDVPERHLGQVKLDTPVDVKAAGMEQPVTGKVELINGRIDPETRTFRVRIGIDNRQGRMQPGGFVRAWLPIESDQDTLVVPRTAVSFTEGRPAVFIYRAEGGSSAGGPGRVARRAVELGIVSRDACEVVEGLRPGDLVVLTNPALLADQMPVQWSTEGLGESPKIDRLGKS